MNTMTVLTFKRRSIHLIMKLEKICPLSTLLDLSPFLTIKIFKIIDILNFKYTQALSIYVKK